MRAIKLILGHLCGCCLCWARERGNRSSDGDHLDAALDVGCEPIRKRQYPHSPRVVFQNWVPCIPGGGRSRNPSYLARSDYAGENSENVKWDPIQIHEMKKGTQNVAKNLRRGTRTRGGGIQTGADRLGGAHEEAARVRFYVRSLGRTGRQCCAAVMLTIDPKRL